MKIKVKQRNTTAKNIAVRTQHKHQLQDEWFRDFKRMLGYE